MLNQIPTSEFLWCGKVLITEYKPSCFKAFSNQQFPNHLGSCYIYVQSLFFQNSVKPGKSAKFTLFEI